MNRNRILSLCSLTLLLSSLGTVAWAQRDAGSSGTPDPSITTQPKSTAVGVGKTATFSVVAKGATKLQYQWYKNNNSSPVGTNSASYTTPATSDQDSGSQFYVVVSDTAGSVTSQSANLYVDDPPVIGSQPQNQTVTVPGVAVFDASLSKGWSQDLKIQWFKNGQPVSGGTSWGELDYEVASTADNNALFTARFTNAAGSATTNAARLTVKGDTITGTYPIVGNWAGKATITSPDGTVTTSQVVAAFTQNAYSITGTVVFTDDNGVAEAGAGMASLNNTAVFTAVGGDPSYDIAGSFSANLFSFTGTGVGTDGSGGGGNLTVSADKKTLTGSGTVTDGTKMSWTLKRQ